MDFSEDIPAGRYIINAYSANSITINRCEYKQSVYVSPQRLIKDIPLQRSEHINSESLQFVLDIQPELFILGTGQQLQLPAPIVIATLAKHNIRFEAMDHAAACRTYAVLAAEQRNVGALLLLDPID